MTGSALSGVKVVIGYDGTPVGFTNTAGPYELVIVIFGDLSPKWMEEISLYNDIWLPLEFPARRPASITHWIRPAGETQLAPLDCIS